MRVRRRLGPGRASPGSLRRGVLAVTAAVLVVLLLGAAGLILDARLLALANQRSARVSTALDDTAVLLGLFVDEQTGLRGHLVGGQTVFLRSYQSAKAQIPGTAARLRAAIQDVPGAEDDLDEALRVHAAWQRDYAEIEIADVARGRLAEAQAVFQSGQGMRLFDQIRARMSDLRATLSAAAADDRAQAQRLQGRLIALLILALVVLTGVVAAGTLTLLRHVIGPLARLARASREVAARAETGDAPTGDAPTGVVLSRAHGVRLPVEGPAEVRSLAEDVEQMRHQLSAQLDQARQAAEALRQHSPAVVALRDALRAGGHPVPGLDLAARLDPAEGVLAGDWYDLVQLDGGRLAVVVGDVAGHGPTSAVFALRLKHSLAVALRVAATPGEALAIVAEGLADVDPELFATVFVAVVDVQADTLDYASAGHPSGVLLTGADSGPDTVELPPTGPLLSPVVPAWACRTETRPFGPGDAVVVFTDGIAEARDAAGRQYGVERVRDLVAGATGGAETVVDALIEDTRQFTRPRRPGDDRTVVCVRRVIAPPRVSRPQANE